MCVTIVLHAFSHLRHSSAHAFMCLSSGNASHTLAILLWGPYFWADGITPRIADGLVWQRSDFTNDGVHPTLKGREKVADQLLRFFKDDAGTKMWFVKK
jgi:hypothetical protein